MNSALAAERAGGEMSNIRVLVVDNHHMLRAALRFLIDSQTDMNVIGEASCIQDAIELAPDISADLIVLDVCSPSGTGTSRIRQLRAAYPLTKVLVLNMHDDPAYVRSAIAAGAMGYVTKSAINLDLIAAIRVVNSGRGFVMVGSVKQFGTVPQTQTSCVAH